MTARYYVRPSEVRPSRTARATAVPVFKFRVSKFDYSGKTRREARLADSVSPAETRIGPVRFTVSGLAGLNFRNLKIDLT